MLMETEKLIPQRDRVTERWGYVLEKNSFIISPKFDDAGVFYGNTAVVGSFSSSEYNYSYGDESSDKLRFGFIDVLGNLITEYKYFKVEFVGRLNVFNCIVSYEDPYTGDWIEEVDVINLDGEVLDVSPSVFEKEVEVVSNKVYFKGYSYFSDGNYRKIIFAGGGRYFCLKKDIPHLEFDLVNIYGDFLSLMDWDFSIPDDFRFFVYSKISIDSPFCVNGKYGWIGLDGRISIPFVYEYLEKVPEQNLFIAKFNGKYSLIGLDGRLINHFVFDAIEYILGIDGCIGKIGDSLHIFLEENSYFPYKITSVGDFVTIPMVSFNEFSGNSGVNTQILGCRGKILFSGDIQSIIKVQNGFCALRFNEKFGMINFKGVFLIPNVYDFCFKVDMERLIFAKDGSKSIVLVKLENAFSENVKQTEIDLPEIISFRDSVFSSVTNSDLIKLEIHKYGFYRKSIGYIDAGGECYWESVGKFRLVPREDDYYDDY